MPFTLRPYRRFPVCCPVTYHAGPFQGQGTIWNLSCTDSRLSSSTYQSLLLQLTHSPNIHQPPP